MSKSLIPFADLHHHSENSLLDGFGSVRQHVQRCKELGHTAVAMTEHGTLRGMLALEAACAEENMQPIYGCEFYVTENHLVRSLTDEQAASVTVGLKGKEATAAKKALADSLGINERRHLVILAENEEGIRNLIRLSNIANRDGFYHRPRIDLALLGEHSEGLIVNSGCVGSVIAQSALGGDIERAIDDTIWFAETFGDRFSLELQPHPIEEQESWNKMAVMLAKQYDIRLVASNDSHYPAPDDWRTHDTLVCIGHRDRIDDCDRMRYVVETFGLKSADDMVEAFARSHSFLDDDLVAGAVERAAEQADRCRAVVWKPKTILLPQVTKADPDEELQDLCLDGWDWRGTSGKVYVKRLAHELKVISQMGFAPYFLVVHDMIAWARNEGIMVGPGRGSAAGSLVCYLLGITGLDPLEHGLLFERFLTPGRKDWPDIDIDFEDRRRHEVFAYLRERYGEENVAQISTLSRMKGKSALRDVARAHGVDQQEVNDVASAIVEELTRDGEIGSIEASLAKDIAMKEFDMDHPLVIEQAIRLEGHIRHVGVHPAGVVASPIPLTDFVPMERRLVSGVETIVTAFDKNEIPEMGLVKLDVLGLKTLSVLADASRLVEERTGEGIDFESLPFTDQDVLDAFTDGDSVGVFQFDSPTARAATADVVFTSFDDVVALNALNRPGTSKSGLADDWRARKGGAKGADQNPIVAEICSDTLGVIVYQEHVIRILQDLAGYSPEEAGRLRKAISKSAGVGYLEEERPRFVAGAGVRGMEAEDAEALWSQIEQFGAYGFNRSHSAAYGAIAYWCMWTKLNYPAEFFCALLTHESEPAEASRVAREALRRGVPVRPPSVNLSRGTWAVSPTGELVAGLEMVKGVGDKPAGEIGRNAPYASFVDFVVKVNRRAVHRGVMVALAKAGALTDIIPNAKWFIEHAEPLLKLVGKKGWTEKVTAQLEASAEEDGFDDEDAKAIAITVGITGTDPTSVLDAMFAELLRPRKDWTSVEDCFDGSLIFGVLTAKKVGTSGKRRWAALEVEGIDGERVRLRLDDEGYQQFRGVLDAGLGTLVAARVMVGKGGGARPTLLVDLLEMRRRWRADEPLEWYERALCRTGLHPAGSGIAKWWKGGTALVLRVTERRDRTGRWMAFVTCDGGVGVEHTREMLCFADLWEEVDEIVIPGSVIRIKGKLESRGAILANSIEEV